MAGRTDRETDPDRPLLVPLCRSRKALAFACVLFAPVVLPLLLCLVWLLLFGPDLDRILRGLSDPKFREKFAAATAPHLTKLAGFAALHCFVIAPGIVLCLAAAESWLEVSRREVALLSRLHRWFPSLRAGPWKPLREIRMPWSEIDRIELRIVRASSPRSSWLSIALVSPSAELKLPLCFKDILSVVDLARSMAPGIAVAPGARWAVDRLRGGATAKALAREIDAAAKAFARHRGTRGILFGLYLPWIARNRETLRQFLEELPGIVEERERVAVA